MVHLIEGFGESHHHKVYLLVWLDGGPAKVLQLGGVVASDTSMYEAMLFRNDDVVSSAYGRMLLTTICFMTLQVTLMREIGHEFWG